MTPAMSLDKWNFLLPVIEAAQTAPEGKGVALYAIAQGDSVKVGISARPSTRLADLQSGSGAPLSLAKEWRFHNRLAALRTEQAMHRLFAPYRTHGEWFRVELPRVLEVADEIFEAFEAQRKSLGK